MVIFLKADSPLHEIRKKEKEDFKTFITSTCKNTTILQRAKKVMSDSPRLVDFAIALVNFVPNLPDRKVLFFGGNSNTEGFGAYSYLKMTCGLASTC